MRKLFTLLIALFIWLGALQAITVQVGSGTATSANFPITAYFGYSYSQQIYTQAQIAVSGPITKIRFYHQSGTITNSTAWVVYLGHTTKTTFSSTTDWVPLASLTEVFNGSMTFPGPGNWVEITLSTPFTYNNTDNLVVAIDENTASYAAANVYWYSFTSGANTGIYYRSDGTNPNPATPPTATGRSASINQIQFDITTADPTLEASPLSLSFPMTANGAYSTEQSYSLSGSNLTAGPIAVTAPTGFEVSLTSGSGFGSSASISYTAPTLASTPVYVRFAPNAAGTTFSGNVSNVGGGATKNVAVSGTSECATYSSLNENFNGVTVPALPNCWSFVTSYVGSTGTTINTTYNSSPNCVSLYNSGATATANILLVSPQLTNLSSGTYRLKFYAKSSSALVTTVIVGTLSNPADAATFTPFQTVTINTTSFTQSVVNFASYTGTDTYIAFRHPSNSTYSNVYIDDVIWEPLPTCVEPASLLATGVTLTGANLTWTPGGTETAWEYAYGIAPFAMPSGAGTASTSSSVNPLSGLTTNQNYQFYVRSNCGAEFSTWSGPAAFRTGYCIPTGATNYYLTNVKTTGATANFDNTTIASTGGYADYSATISCTVPQATSVTIALTPSSGTNYFYIWIDWNNDLDFADAGEVIAATTSYTSSYSITYTVPLATAVGSYRMRVANSWSGAITPCGPSSNGEYEDYTFNVSAAPDCIPPTSLTAVPAAYQSVLGWTENGTATQWDIEWGAGGFTPSGIPTLTVGTNPYTLTGLVPSTAYSYYVRANCGSATSTWVGPKTFSTTISCPAPTTPVSSGITISGATIDWTTTGVETAWDIEYGPAGFVAGSGVGYTEVLGTATKPYPITGLTAGTTYDYYIRAACGVGDVSLWTTKASFTTTFLPVTMPFTENFETGSSTGIQKTASTYSAITIDAAAANASSFGLHHTGGSAATGWTGSSGAVTATNAWIDNVTHQATATIIVDANGSTTCRMGFDLKQTFSFAADYSWFRVLVNDVQVNDMNGLTDYKPVTASSDPFATKEYNFDSYAGSVFTIKLQSSGKYNTAYYAPGDNAFVDNIVIAPLAECPKPIALTAIGITSTGADLGWTEAGTATMWNIEYGPVGFTQGTGTMVMGVTHNPQNILGLTPSTSYAFYVQADCGGGSTSLWSGPKTFTTACETTVAPFIEDFELATFPPVCWTNAAVSGTYTWARSTAASGNGAGTGSTFANFYSQSAGSTYELTSNEFDMSALATPTLKFDYAYATYTGGEVDQLDVYYSVNNGSSWVLLLAMPGGPTGILNTGGTVEASFVPTSSQWGSQNLSLPAGTNKIKFQAISAWGNNLFLDNIQVYSPVAHDVAALSIDMNPVIAAGEVTPLASVKNEGTNAETFDVTLEIGTYTSTKTVTALAAGATLQVTFDSWTSIVGDYTATLTTALTGDLVPGNDETTKDLKVKLLNKVVYAYNAYSGATGTDPEGPTSFNLGNPGVLNSIADQSALNFVAGGTWANGVWYGNVSTDNTLITIDPATGARTVIGALGIALNGISYNTANGILYGVSPTSLYTINMTTGLATLVGTNTGIQMVNFAINAAGVAYSIDLTNDVLGTVNLTTGIFTAIGPIGFNAHYAQDMEFDRETGDLYVAAQDLSSGWLALADLTTGNTLKIGDFEGGAEITGLGIPYTSVTFQVNMSQQTVSPDGVHIAGSFGVEGDPTWWNPSATALTDMGSGVWAVTLALAPGSYEYKFINGNAWGQDESIPGACNVGGNRGVTVTITETLPLVCFGSCSNCVTQIPLTLTVDMANQTVSPLGVHVAGSFQGWNPGSTVMTQIPATTMYEVMIYVDENSTHQYKFVNGNDWPDSEVVPEACGVPDGFGGFNRTVSVTTGMYAADVVCFGECSLCAPATKTLNVTVFFEGLYNGAMTMREALNDLGDPQFGVGVADQITVELHNETDYATIEHSAANVDLNTDGTATVTIPASFSGMYWLTIKHRNSIETVSAAVVDFSGATISYDFSTSASQAFGDNIKDLGEGVYGIYAGDVDQDGGIGVSDMGMVDNQSAAFASGYLPEDIDGDGSVGVSDMGIIDNNSSAFISAVTP